MKFKDFVVYLERLEKISSRLAITDILVELLKKLESGESRVAMYMIVGRVVPDFEPVEFGMAVKMVIRAVALASDRKIDVVERAYKGKGDMGLLVRELEFGSLGRNLSVSEVHSKLLEIAKDSGTGSQERKVESLKELLLSTSPDERKYIVRIILGKLRLGFSSKTIFDALSQMEKGDKSLRKQLDERFQIFPDVGVLVEQIKDSGLSGLAKIKVKSGVPVVPALCQRLNSYQEIVSKMKDVAVERKYDGTRVQIHFNRKSGEIRTYTRNLEETSAMFPELKEIGEWIKGDDVILDSEAVGIDPKTQKVMSFQMTITRKRKHGIEETSKTVPLRFFVFDILEMDGESLIEKPYFERREILSKIIKPNRIIVPDEYVRADDPSEVEKMHGQYLKEGFEGAVIKKWDGTYLPGRQGWNWVKIKEAEGTTGKLSDTFDLVVMGYYYGRGKRTGFGIGAFLTGVRKGDRWVSIAKIGTGLSDEDFRELKKKLEKHVVAGKPNDYDVSGSLVADVWVEPEIVVEVAADELTNSPVHAGGLALRFPRLIKFRDDKGPSQSTTWKEVEEIARLSKVS